MPAKFDLVARILFATMLFMNLLAEGYFYLAWGKAELKLLVSRLISFATWVLFAAFVSYMEAAKIQGKELEFFFLMLAFLSPLFLLNLWDTKFCRVCGKPYFCLRHLLRRKECWWCGASFKKPVQTSPDPQPTENSTVSRE